MGKLNRAKSPDQIGDYRIMEIVGSGGMGVVYRCRHSDTGREVAIKTIKVPHEGMLQNIRREIHTLAEIKHPGVIRIIDKGEHDGLPWYAMPFLKGLTLRKYSNKIRPLLKRVAAAKRLSSKTRARFEEQLDESLNILLKICETLSFLHGEGIVHRDIKPENIFIKKDNVPVLMDFGLMTYINVSVSREALLIDQRGAGTLSYVAPEQLRGQFVDARADLYSLGCIIYELLTGILPFHGKTVFQIMKAQLLETPPSPAKLVDLVPEEIDSIVSRLLSKDVRRRVGYASDVAKVLAQPIAAIKGFKRRPKSRHYLYRSSFVGRETQLFRLKHYMHETQKAMGSVVFISGESGVGKTRLAMEFGNAAIKQHFQVLTGECHYSSGRYLESFWRPFQVIADYCLEHGQEETDKILGERGVLLSFYLPQLKNLPGQEKFKEPEKLPSEEARIRLFSYLFKTFQEFAKRKPLVLILDDLQWADDLVLGFVEYIVRGELLKKTKLMLVGIFRSEELNDRLENLITNEGIEEIHLDRLTEYSIATMVENMLALDVAPAGFSEYLTRHSEGNPFFVGEYLRNAIDAGILRRDTSGTWQFAVGRKRRQTYEDYSELPLPGSLRDLIRRRLDDLPDNAQVVVNIAAVIGREFNENMLASLAELDESEFYSTINELQRRHIFSIVADGTFQFTHHKIREIAFEAMKKMARKRIHRAAAEYLDSLPDEEKQNRLAEMGYHLEEAGRKKGAKTCYLQGARQAKDLYSYIAAEHLFRSYLRLIKEPGEESISVRNELGADVLLFSGKAAEAREEHDLALKESRKLKDRKLEAFCLLFLGDVRWSMGNIDEALELYDDALIIIRELGDRLTEGRTLLSIANILTEQGYSDKAHDLYLMSLDIAREVDNLERQGRILGNLAVLYKHKGNIEEAQKLYDHSIKLAREFKNKRQEAVIMGNLANLLFEQGQLEEASKRYTQALKLTRKIGFRWNEGMILCNLGVLHHYTKEHDKAIKLFAKAGRIARKIGNQRLEVIVLHRLGNLHMDMGTIDKARRSYDQARMIAHRTNDRRLEGIICLALATLNRRSEVEFHMVHDWALQAESILREIDDTMNLILILCEIGHSALALDQEDSVPLEEIASLVEQLELSPMTEQYRVYVHLKEAVEAYLDPDHQNLFRGELIENLPPGLKHYLTAKNLLTEELNQAVNSD